MPAAALPLSPLLTRFHMCRMSGFMLYATASGQSQRLCSILDFLSIVPLSSSMVVVARDFAQEVGGVAFATDAAMVHIAFKTASSHCCVTKS